MANAEHGQTPTGTGTTYPVGLFSITMAGYVFALRSTNQRALLLKSRNLASLASVSGPSIFALSCNLIFSRLKGRSLGPDFPNPSH